MINQQQKTQLPSLIPMHSEQANFQQNYQQLQAGINRIRYIKKKQMRNHNIMTQHLANLLKQLQKQQRNNSAPSINIQLPKSQSQPLPVQHPFKYNLQQKSPYQKKNVKNMTRGSHRQKHFHTNPNDKENNNERKIYDKNVDHYSNFHESKPQTRQEKQRLLLTRKQQNYQEMRQLRNQRQERKKEIYQQKINEARQRKAKALISREQGRKNMEENYYKYLDSIKAQKNAQKDKKNKIQQQKYQKLLEIQRQEEEELAQYEKSIIMEQELKSFLERASNKGGSREVIITDDTFF